MGFGMRFRFSRLCFSDTSKGCQKLSINLPSSTIKPTAPIIFQVWTLDGAVQLFDLVGDRFEAPIDLFETSIHILTKGKYLPAQFHIQVMKVIHLPLEDDNRFIVLGEKIVVLEFSEYPLCLVVQPPFEDAVFQHIVLARRTERGA